MAVWARSSHVDQDGLRARLLSIAVFLALSGCGGGGGIDIAGGQGPDPVVIDVAIAYVKRPLPTDDQGDLDLDTDTREVITFDIGADLYLRERASPSAVERNITLDETQGLGDIRDLDVSYDGTKVIFAMRAPFGSVSSRVIGSYAAPAPTVS